MNQNNSADLYNQFVDQASNGNDEPEEDELAKVRVDVVIHFNNEDPTTEVRNYGCTVVQAHDILDDVERRFGVLIEDDTDDDPEDYTGEDATDGNEFGGEYDKGEEFMSDDSQADGEK